VFPVTSRRVKKTTLPMVRIRNSILPNCLAKPAAKADSVSVLVSEVEFANFASIVFATRTASSGLSSLRMYHPAVLLTAAGTFSSKCFQ